MRPLIIANWKMNLTFDEAKKFFFEITENIKLSNNVIIAPPALYITTLQQISSKIAFCTQDISIFGEDGAYTGELSAKMIKSCGINYSLIGHSERREHFYESNEAIRSKVENCLAADITPIVCFGETKEERQKGTYKELLISQINQSIPINAENIILAYEPLWAVGSGTVASIQEIAEIANFLQENSHALVAKNITLVYGGSVNSKNYYDIVSIAGINGVLIGKASLNIKELTNIINSSL